MGEPILDNPKVIDDIVASMKPEHLTQDKTRKFCTDVKAFLNHKKVIHYLFEKEKWTQVGEDDVGVTYLGENKMPVDHPSKTAYLNIATTEEGDINITLDFVLLNSYWIRRQQGARYRCLYIRDGKTKEQHLLVIP